MPDSEEVSAELTTVERMLREYIEKNRELSVWKSFWDSQLLLQPDNKIAAQNRTMTETAIRSNEPMIDYLARRAGVAK